MFSTEQVEMVPVSPCDACGVPVAKRIRVVMVPRDAPLDISTMMAICQECYDVNLTDEDEEEVLSV